MASTGDYTLTREPARGQNTPVLQVLVEEPLTLVVTAYRNTTTNEYQVSDIDSVTSKLLMVKACQNF